VPGYDSQAVSQERCGVDSSLTRAPALCQNIKCSGQGSGCGSCKPVRASSEAESHPRGCPALERGGVSPEGALSPQARHNPTRGGVRPSSEAESHLRGLTVLERGGVLVIWRCTPRAKRGFARGVPGPIALVGR
jgi:hypothetical protein